MKHDEMVFLAQVAIGWFSMEPTGRFTRRVRWSKTTTPRLCRVDPTRADVSMSDGYPVVMFYDPLTRTRRKVFAHRIVWMLVSGEMIPEPMQVNHIDGVRANNYPSNLELVTPSENVKHGIRVLGRKAKAQDGEDNAQAKLTPNQVNEIRALWDAKAMSQKALGKRFGVGQATISAVVLRKSWRHLA